MIEIGTSPTADTRTCDFRTVTQQTLLDSSRQHIEDVQAALGFFVGRLLLVARAHDRDKITDIAGFHRDFVHGFAEGHTAWWDAHRRLNRHHLNMADGVPSDVNLFDVLDYIADCVMAGMARSGSVYPLVISGDVLAAAFTNTTELLKSEVVVRDALVPDEVSA